MELLQCLPPTNPLFSRARSCRYALVLTLVSMVVIAALTLLGPSIGGAFSRITTELGGSVASFASVAITRSDYDSGTQELHLDARENGNYDPSVTLTASPGGVVQARTDHYHLRYTLTGCPCPVTVTSSASGSASVTVGP